MFRWRVGVEEKSNIIVGGLLVYRVDNFKTTAEREQFRILCQLLKERYSQSEDYAAIIGNYNIGCELDALFIKKDAIMVLEFKNYGGQLVANENGDWTCDGKKVKGGSRSTVLQQARTNHSIVKKELKLQGIPANNVKDLPLLVVFNQPLQIENHLTATTQSWLHITDNNHFLEKIEDITCPKTDITLDLFQLIIERLYLEQFYIEDLSNFLINDSISLNEESSDIAKTEQSLSPYDLTALPQWLDDYIFNKLGAKYCPSNSEMTVIDWDKSDMLNYLGTYFPRSYAEACCIMSNYLKANPDFIMDKETVSIFDFGCGTGGEIIGVISQLKRYNNGLKKVFVHALDGNQEALRLCQSVSETFSNETCIEIEMRPIAVEIDDVYDMSILDSILRNEYDIIISFKAICEFVTLERFDKDNAYGHIVRTLLSKLKQNGIMLLEDVTSYSDVSKEWLPKIMDAGIKNIPCRLVHQNEGYNQTIYVSHSRKANDVSKVAWRIITH